MNSFLVGGAVAVLVASVVGYLLAAAGLSPIEAMRRRAERVSLDRAGERLPLPAAHDEVRRLGETLNDMLSRLQASFERERRFVADASHELRTPLAVLKTELEAALRLGGHSPEVRESLAAAVDEADQLAQLAEDLLLIARAADKGLPVRVERVQIRELLERAAQRFSDRAAERGRTISVERAGGARGRPRSPPRPPGAWEPDRQRPAPRSGRDRARRSCAQRRPGDRRGRRRLGLSARAAPRAFERFARGDAARTRGGAGLGLAIVSAIAEAHGGSVEIVPGRGATVRISLPGGSQDHFRRAT